ncbi:glycosyltransferase family 39 protein [Chloroflexus sp.]|uniref:glycosyltransferase family 39 protein n=1 Tax=Chloroflexus sp. TaxID=1904827 RepID=UPI002624E3BD|nr:glycosyltransferase family 39 protein [uncultured Chloroflexus sp.]
MQSDYFGKIVKKQSFIVNIFVFTLMILSIIAVSVYFYVAVLRINRPFALEWLEGHSFVQVLRILNGQFLYAPPTYEFISTIYMPLYFYTAAIVAHLIGNILVAMRLVSLLASIGIFVMIYRLARLRSLSPALSLIAAGLFAATYEVSGYWFDIGRIDTLAVFFLLAAYVTVIMKPVKEELVGAGGGILFFLYNQAKRINCCAICCAVSLLPTALETGVLAGWRIWDLCRDICHNDEPSFRGMVLDMHSVDSRSPSGFD